MFHPIDVVERDGDGPRAPQVAFAKRDVRHCASCWIDDDTVHVTDRPIRSLDPLAATHGDLVFRNEFPVNLDFFIAADLVRVRVADAGWRVLDRTIQGWQALEVRPARSQRYAVCGGVDHIVNRDQAFHAEHTLPAHNKVCQSVVPRVDNHAG